MYRGEWKEQDVVIKVPKGPKGNAEWNELQAFLDIPPHDNILPLLGICTDFKGANRVNKLCFVTSFVEFGSLNEIFRDESRHHVLCKLQLNRASNIYKIALDIASGLAHLHANNIIHRDLALRNVLIGSDLSALVCDFGMSRCLQEETDDGKQSAYYKIVDGSMLPIRWYVLLSFLFLIFFNFFLFILFILFIYFFFIYFFFIFIFFKLGVNLITIRLSPESMGGKFSKKSDGNFSFSCSFSCSFSFSYLYLYLYIYIYIFDLVWMFGVTIWELVTAAKTMPYPEISVSLACIHAFTY